MHDLSKGRILVTGGAGFIGSALIWALNQRGLENILVCDLLGEGDKFKNLVPLRFNDYIEADALSDAIDEAPRELDDVRTVFHLGANSATTETNCRHLVQNNYEYTKVLASWALERGSRFVYASSAATYGDGAQGMDDRREDLHRLRPLNMYGYSKHLFDLYAQRCGVLGQIVGLKYFNVFGPNEDHKGDMRSVVNKAYPQIRDTGKVQLFKSYRPDFADGEQQRDFLYVKDAVAMTIFLAEHLKCGGLYNLGSGQAQTWKALVEPIFAALSKEPAIEFIDMPDSLRAKYQYHTCADISKLRADGYTAEVTTLADSVTDYVSNYLIPGRRLGDEPA
ncbi:MAG: ADP-glyceromanno-heptose 6-epimerase [Opitutales bacterium]